MDALINSWLIPNEKINDKKDFIDKQIQVLSIGKPMIAEMTQVNYQKCWIINKST